MTPEILNRCARAAQVRCGKDLIDITLGIVDGSYTPSIGMELILSYAVAFADAALSEERSLWRNLLIPDVSSSLAPVQAVAAHDATIREIARREERGAHRTTVKMATELLDEIRAQWGQDYLWKKWGIDAEIAALIARTP